MGKSYDIPNGAGSSNVESFGAVLGREKTIGSDSDRESEQFRKMTIKAYWRDKKSLRLISTTLVALHLCAGRKGT
jgi:hypothetical protein